MNFIERIVCIMKICATTTYRTLKVMLKPANKGYFYKEVKLWAEDVLRATKTEVVVSGAQHLDLTKQYIYIANHTNLIDIPILIKALQSDNINFVYRKSLQKVPMLGLALRKSPFVPIIRESSKGAMQSVEQANQLLKNGSVIMFPEGTRSFSGKVGKFKRGAFLLSALSNQQITPITIAGVELVTPSTKGWRINKGRVFVNINPPVGNVPQDRNLLNKFMAEMQNLIANQQEEMSK